MTATLGSFPVFRAFDADGAPLVGGFLYSYAAGTLTPLATYVDQAGITTNTNPVQLDTTGSANVWFGSSAYKLVLKTATGSTLWTVDNYQPESAAATLQADLASTASAALGDALVGVKKTGGGATTDHLFHENRPFNACTDFGASPTQTAANNTTYLQAAINAAISSGRTLYIPSGTYSTNATLTINGKVKIVGDGNQTTIISLTTASSAVYAITVSIPDNSSIVGMDLGGFGIVANAGAAIGCGLLIQTTLNNSAVSQSIVHDLYIRNVTVGVTLDGIIYMSTFRNITVSGTVVSYGWYANNVGAQTIYNSYTDLEVTGCGNGAYAYYIFSPASHFRNLTCDGCCWFNGAYSHVQGLTIEGMASSPASIYGIQALSLFSLSDVAIINVPNSKCVYGIDAQNVRNITGIRIPDSGAGNQPDSLLNLYVAHSGTVSNVKCDRAITNLLESYLSDAVLNGFVFTNCSDITARSLTYEQGTWTPGFATWSTAPSVTTAKYTKIGRQVVIMLYCNGGACADYSTITGLPFTASPLGTVTMVSGDVAKKFTARVNGTSIDTIPSQALTTGPIYWNLSATYFV